ncbi:MAG: hypothetical protein RLZZ283_111 [Candidatus Parcubacteria bacterium]
MDTSEKKTYPTDAERAAKREKMDAWVKDATDKALAELVSITATLAAKPKADNPRYEYHQKQIVLTRLNLKDAEALGFDYFDIGNLIGDVIYHIRKSSELKALKDTAKGYGIAVSVGNLPGATLNFCNVDHMPAPVRRPIAPCLPKPRSPWVLPLYR